MTDSDLKRVLAIVAGLHRNETLLAQHRPGDPEPQFSVPARISGASP